MKLIPTIIQDAKSREVYMLGYMNDKALGLTRQTGLVHFWSRNRNCLWKKGETSGNLLKVDAIFEDCDSDTLLILVNLVGTVVCHTGKKSCFNNLLKK